MPTIHTCHSKNAGEQLCMVKLFMEVLRKGVPCLAECLISMIWKIFTYCLPCIRHNYKGFTFINPFDPPNNPTSWGQLSLHCRWKNWDSERLITYSRAYLITGRGRMWMEPIWSQKLGSPKHKLHCLSVSLRIFLKYLFIYCYSGSMNCLILFNYLDNHAVFGDHYADNEFSWYNSINAEKKR